VAATYLVPQPLLFIPMADIIERMGLGNTLTSVILTYPTLLIPFCAWLLMGYFKSVPREMEDSAHRRRQPAADHVPRLPAAVHAGLHLRRHLRVHPGAERVPLCADLSDRHLGAHGAGRRHRRTDPRRRVLLGQLKAAALLGSIPVAIIYSFFVEHYVAGPTAGSVK
jgi:multiple sugar transport system permease protein